jgi:hypothetical protein
MYDTLLITLTLLQQVKLNQQSSQRLILYSRFKKAILILQTRDIGVETFSQK